jgi:predicted nucleic acid-binding protein
VTGTLVDSNVLLDVLQDDPVWYEWSARALETAANRGPLLINPLIYAEVSIGFARIEELEAAMPPTDFLRAPLPWEAAFLAGKCFLDYRRRGGPRGTVLPDFFIGAHAAVEGLDLLTRDAHRYQTYFPTLRLVGSRVGPP